MPNNNVNLSLYQYFAHLSPPLRDPSLGLIGGWLGAMVILQIVVFVSSILCYLCLTYGVVSESFVHLPSLRASPMVLSM
jgi:hypothetical protein